MGSVVFEGGVRVVAGEEGDVAGGGEGVVGERALSGEEGVGWNGG